MPSYGLCVQLTHLGLSRSSLHLSDISDGVDVLNSFRKAGPVYVPYLATVTLVYSGSVAIAFESGSIRTFIGLGHLSASFVLGTTLLAALPLPTDLDIVGQVQGSVLYFDGTNWVQLPPGAAGEVLTTGGVGADPAWSANGIGDVVGPAGATDTALARYDTATGKLLQDSTVLLDGGGNMVFDGGASLSVDTIQEVTPGNGVLIGGSRNYGALAADPGAPAPSDGDTYWNTVLAMDMRYDGARAKWLSTSESILYFGRALDTATGSYFDGVNQIQFTATRGFPAAFNGTVVALSFTRDDVDAATVEVTQGGVLLVGLLSAATYNSDTTLDADFASGTVLGVRNQAGGNTVTNLMGWVRLKWRA